MKKSDLKKYINQILREEASMSTNAGGIMNLLQRCTPAMEELGELAGKLESEMKTGSLKQNIERANIDMKDVVLKIGTAKTFFNASANLLKAENVGKQIQDEAKLKKLKEFISGKIIPKLGQNRNNLVNIFNSLSSQIDKKVMQDILSKVEKLGNELGKVKFLIDNPDNNGDLRAIDKMKINSVFTKRGEPMTGGQVNESRIRTIIRQELKRAGY